MSAFYTEENLSANNTKEKKRRSYFMENLHSIIEQKQFAGLISWASNGKSFIISDPEAFEKIVLPILCNHSNYSSFVRQLNMYDFKKRRVSPTNGIISYSHALFLEGRSNLLQDIVRKNPRRAAQMKKVQSQIETEEFAGKNNLKKTAKKKIDNNLQGNINQTDLSEAKSADLDVQYAEQLVEKVAAEGDKDVMSMIKAYLDEDDEIEDFENYGEQNYNLQYERSEDFEVLKKLKKSPSFSFEYGSEGSQSDFKNQYIRMDLSTAIVDSVDPCETSTPQELKLSRLFRASDFYRCQNLISAMVNYKKKTENYTPEINPYLPDSYSKDVSAENSQAEFDLRFLSFRD